MARFYFLTRHGFYQLLVPRESPTINGTENDFFYIYNVHAQISIVELDVSFLDRAVICASLLCVCGQ